MAGTKYPCKQAIIYQMAGVPKRQGSGHQVQTGAPSISKKAKAIHIPKLLLSIICNNELIITVIIRNNDVIMM